MEFDGEWMEHKLGNLCSIFKSGAGITSEQIDDSGDYPVYGGNGLRGFTSTYTHDGFYLLIGRQGALCGNINRSYGKAYISEHAIAVSGNNLADTNWLAYKLDYLKLNRFSESSAQPGLSVNKLVRIEFATPSKPEQTKIANFLTAVDEKIQLLTEKFDLLAQYKKGVMQKIFSQELRFKDDDGREFPEWDFVELEKVSAKVNKKNKDLSINNVLTNSATQGIVSQSDYFDRNIANQNNLGGYYIVETDDFVYNPRISANALVGPIKRNHLTIGVMSPLYFVFRFTKGNLNFYEQYFQTNHWHDYMKSISNTGARHDRMNITNESFFGLPLPCPVEKEQLKISNFLIAIDDKITQTQAELDAVKQYKQGLLQQMFV